MAIGSGSAALDQVPSGGAGCPASDQRGVLRPQGPACDIGAFELQNPTTLTVSRSGTGSGSVTSSPAGIDCGATCSHAYDQGTTVTLTATPASGSRFAGWSGGGCPGTGDCQVTLNGDTEVTATFADATRPNTVITSGPSGPTHDPTPTFHFSSSEGDSTFQCRLDSAPFAACTSPRTTGHLADGSHTFYVRAIDPSSNVDPTPASRRIKVDTHAPSSKARAPASTHSSPFTVGYTVADPSPSSGVRSVELWVRRPGQTTYSKVSTDTTPATRTFSYKPTVGGTYRFYTRARDAAGNYEAAPSTPDASTSYTR
jgi:hypothetical protein